jgi:PilZ domain
MDISSIRSTQQTADPAGAMTQLAAASASAQSRPGLLSFLRKPASWVRRHHRYPCCIVGVLDILDRGVPLDGLVTEISEGGALFRTASTFIFDRRRSTVALRFTDREWRGEIVNVKADGYGIRLDSPATNEEIEHIIARYGAPDLAAN